MRNFILGTITGVILSVGIAAHGANLNTMQDQLDRIEMYVEAILLQCRRP